MADFRVDTSELRRAMQAIAKATSRAEAEIINKISKDVTLHAIRETKRVEPAKIRAEMGGGRAERIVIARYRKKGWKMQLSRAAVQKEAKKMVAARVRSSAYIRAGWFKAAQQLGGRGGRVYSRGRAALGRATKAQPQRLRAVIENYSTGASVAGTNGLKRAIAKVAKREIAWANKRMQRAFRDARR